MDVTFMMVIGVMVLGGTIAGIISEYFKHREKIAQLQSNASGKGADPAQLEQLLKRVDALEKQCAKLQEQVLIAHEQLADERRALDNKLAAMLPDFEAQQAVRASSSRPAERSKTIG